MARASLAASCFGLPQAGCFAGDNHIMLAGWENTLTADQAAGSAPNIDSVYSNARPTVLITKTITAGMITTGGRHRLGSSHLICI
jgi:hypothetical protein